MLALLLAQRREFFTDERLDPSARHVLRVLCDYADATGACHPSYDTLKAQTGMASDATIARALKRLESSGRIAVARQRRKPNRYQIHGFHQIHRFQEWLVSTPPPPIGRDTLTPPPEGR